jgi:signal transduction histidine kinase/ActR/RegA family two-component response regulator
MILDVLANRKVLDRHLDDPSLEVLFRDFERSKIGSLREALAARPLAYSAIYFMVMLLWTGTLSYGSSLQPSISFAADLTPHASLILLVVGLLIYPRRWLWVPVLGFCLVFPIGFLAGSSLRGAWALHPLVTSNLLAVHFGLHLASGLLAGTAARAINGLLHRLLSPYHADLLGLASMALVFAVLALPLPFLLDLYASALPPADRETLGFGPTFVHEVAVNIWRNAAAVSALLLGVLSRPSQRQLVLGLGVALAFPALGLAAQHGLAMFPEMDVCLLALFLVFILPVPVALTAWLIGIPVYAAMTGAFLAHSETGLPQDIWLETYALLAMMLTVYAAILRDLSQHSARARESSLRRLDRVRDFADVGLLSFNLSQGNYLGNAAAARIMAMAQTGNVADFIAQFETDVAAEISYALRPQNVDSVNLLLRRQNPLSANPSQLLRFFLWYETAPSHEKVAYGLVLDTTREHEQAQILSDTLEQLKIKQERQAQLFSIVSHELRTPAAVISMLLDDLDLPEQRPQTMRQLRDATDQLLSTLADMRQTVSPTQNLPVRRVPYAPAELAESIRNMLDPQARLAGITIRIILGPDAHRFRLGDTMRLRQALTNLVRNAIIHSKGHDLRISFHSRMDSGSAMPISVWKVIDNGVGIPEDQVERLFRPFERGGADPRKHADGSGLGLYISKSSIEMLGGSIDHFTPQEGGSGYVIELPEAMATEADLADKSRRDAHIAPETFPSVYLLLAEDNKLVAEVTQAQLSRFIGRVDVVENGVQALDSIAAHKPDILITDLFMPEMDGDELVRTLRQRGFNLPVIGLTAAVVGDDMERFRAVGVETVMSKPLDMKTLRRAILDFLSPAEALPEGSDRDASAT